MKAFSEQIALKKIKTDLTLPDEEDIKVSEAKLKKLEREIGGGLVRWAAKNVADHAY